MILPVLARHAQLLAAHIVFPFPHGIRRLAAALMSVFEEGGRSRLHGGAVILQGIRPQAVGAVGLHVHGLVEHLAQL